MAVQFTNRILLAVSALVVAVSTTACGSSGGTSPFMHANDTATASNQGTGTGSNDSSGQADDTTARYVSESGTHVVMVMEENQDYSTVVGHTTSWPALNSLIRNGALATHYYADTHPSIGNYFMLTTGKLLTNNDSSREVWNVNNLARRMLAAHVSFRIYAEGISRGYVGGNTGAYLVRHNPFALLSDIADNHSVAYNHIWPFTQFATDLANGNLPEFSFIVPDIYHDAHNGTPREADDWLQARVISPLSNHASFQPGGHGVLIVDFDEAADSDTAHGGGHVPAVFWGPLAKTGYRQSSTTLYQHQSMLRTVMALLKLSNLPGAAANAPSMSQFFKQMP